MEIVFAIEWCRFCSQKIFYLVKLGKRFKNTICLTVCQIVRPAPNLNFLIAKKLT